MGWVPNFEVIRGETEHVSFSGHRRRNPTVLIKVGKHSLSRNAFILGFALIICQFLDGMLTYAGLSAFGVHMEGNVFLRNYMNQFGMGPVLFIAKSLAVLMAGTLMLRAHSRRWLRPFIFGLICIYVSLAVLPWTFIHLSARGNDTLNPSVRTERPGLAAESQAQDPAS